MNNEKWYAEENELIGGWSVYSERQIDQQQSFEISVIADGLDKNHALLCAAAPELLTHCLAAVKVLENLTQAEAVKVVANIRETFASIGVEDLLK